MAQPTKGSAVVLAHGLVGWGSRMAERLCGSTYFNGIEHRLRELHGMRVLTPQVSGIAHSSIRGAQLLEQIHAWPERRAGERVAVIGHSQGGLDARWAVSKLGGDGLVSRLITLSTPHHGTALCDAVAIPLITRSPAGVRQAVEKVGVPIDAARFLSCEEMAAFNEDVPDAADVAYLSFGGARRRAHEYWAPFVASAQLLRLIDGPNDGLVSVASSRWGRFMGALAYDHVDMINFPLKRVHRSAMPPLWDYLAALAHDADAVEADDDVYALSRQVVLECEPAGGSLGRG